MNKSAGIAVAAVVVLAIIAAVALTRPRAATESTALPASDSGSITPAFPGYAEAAVQSCVQKAGDNPLLSKAGASPGAINAYCSCFAARSGALITAADAAYIEANKTLPPNFQAKVAPVINACASENGLTARP